MLRRARRSSPAVRNGVHSSSTELVRGHLAGRGFAGGACVDSGSNPRSVVRVKEISITGDEDGRGRALRRTKADSAGLDGR
jgi:hypothetical protein